jgi:sulfur-carrier protein
MHAVKVPSPLRSYTAGAAQVSVRGDSIADVLDSLESAHPGMRFRMIDEQGRIRPHIRIFINQREVRSLDEALVGQDVVHLICALSGG